MIDSTWIWIDVVILHQKNVTKSYLSRKVKFLFSLILMSCPRLFMSFDIFLSDILLYLDLFHCVCILFKLNSDVTHYSIWRVICLRSTQKQQNETNESFFGLFFFILCSFLSLFSFLYCFTSFFLWFFFPCLLRRGYNSYNNHEDDNTVHAAQNRKSTPYKQVWLEK